MRVLAALLLALAVVAQAGRPGHAAPLIERVTSEGCLRPGSVIEVTGRDLPPAGQGYLLKSGRLRVALQVDEASSRRARLRVPPGAQLAWGKRHYIGIGRGGSDALTLRACERTAPPPLAPPPSPSAAEPVPPPRRADEVIVLSAEAGAALALADGLAGEGYRVRARSELAALGGVITVLALPEGGTPEAASEAIRIRFPGTLAAPNDLYAPQSGRVYAPELLNWRGAGCTGASALGLLDTALDLTEPGLAGRNVTVRSFLVAGEAPAAPDHGTAIAAVLIGRDGLLRGDATLLAAAVMGREDVGDAAPAGRLVRALDWLAGAGVPVVLMSLSGPENAVLGRALAGALDRGLVLIAAAGNGGAEGLGYPAAHPGVIAVTAIDAELRLYARANWGAGLAFAAPGVDIWAPAGGGRARYHSGTSFAVPFVAAAAALLRGAGADAGAVFDGLVEDARDLGPPGWDPRFGHGLVQAPRGCREGQ